MTLAKGMNKASLASVCRGLPPRHAEASRERIATLGNFDGLHRGHTALLARLMARKTPGLMPTLITFYPHPAMVLRNTEPILRLNGLRELQRLATEHGIEEIRLLHFTRDLARCSAHDFLMTYLVEQLKVRALVIGADARVGKGGEGDASYIERTLSSAGVAVDVVPLLSGPTGEKIGSRAIRSALLSGLVTDAAQLLGRPYEIEGRVVRGDGRGRTLGFRTANVRAVSRVIPLRGVYATRTVVAGREYRSVTNIGIRPTFGLEQLTIESHLIDYHGSDFYDLHVRVLFDRRIRDEQKFLSVDHLVDQIRRDIAQTI